MPDPCTNFGQQLATRMAKTVACVAIALIAIGLSGCGHDTPTAKTSNENRSRSKSSYSQSNDADFPSILSVGKNAPNSDRRFFDSVPTEARPLGKRLVRLPIDSGSRYWIGRWRSPNGDEQFFCLYSGHPGSSGLTTSCFSTDDYSAGLAYAYNEYGRSIELVGFIPKGGRASLRVGKKIVRLPINRGVYHLVSHDSGPRTLLLTANGETTKEQLEASK